MIVDQENEKQFGSQINIEGVPQQADDQQQIQQKVPEQTSACPIFTIEYYQPYFNIDVRDVKMRLRCAFFPQKPQFLQVIGKNPDLWGPVWITSTLIFLLFSAGNFSNYLSSSDKDNFEYEYSFVPVALITVYGMGFITPVFLTLLFRVFGNVTTLMDVICMYGYSMACFIPILIACVVPSNVFQWILMTYGMLNSTIFLIVNLWDELKKLEQKKFILMGLIVSFQIVLVLMFKLYFFHLIYNSDTD